MAELTLEAAQKIVESFEKNARARDEKGRFVGKEQVKLAKQLIEQNKKVTKSNKTGFQSVVDATREANKNFEEIRNLQSVLKDEQSTATKAQKQLVKLQQKSEDERGKDHDKQIEKQEKLIEESQKTAANIQSQITTTKEQLSPIQKQNLALQERKEALNEMAEGLKTMGRVAEEDKTFRKEQQAIQLEEIELRKQGSIPLSKRLELEKEKAKAQAESDSILQKGFGNLKLGIMNLSEKFGAGAMTIGKSLLALFGLGLLIKFLESDVFKRIREFVAGPSLETFKEIFMPGGEFDGIALAIAGVIGVAVAGLAALTFKALGGGLLVSAFKGLFSRQKEGLDKASGDVKKQKGALDKADKSKVKKPSRVGRLFGAVKSIGGTALEKGAQAAKAVGSKAVSLGKTGLEKGTQLAKQTVQVGTKIGKDAASGAKAVLPKIAGASKAGLKAAGAASKFIPGAGLVIGAGIAAVEGVASGVEEFKESGDAGRAIAEGFGGALSSLSFGLVDKEKFADFFKKEEELTSDQLAQAMAGGPSVGPAQFASLAGGSDAARLRELENELQAGEGAAGSRMGRQRRLDEMKRLEAKMARERAGGGNVTNIVDNSTNSSSNATNNTHMSTDITDRDLDFLASPAI